MFHTDERKKILTWLCGSATVPNDNYDEALEKRLDGTASWIFNENHFMEWKQSLYPLLRLVGIREFRQNLILR